MEIADHKVSPFRVPWKVKEAPDLKGLLHGNLAMDERLLQYVASS